MLSQPSSWIEVGSVFIGAVEQVIDVLIRADLVPLFGIVDQLEGIVHLVKRLENHYFAKIMNKLQCGW